MSSLSNRFSRLSTNERWIAAVVAAGAAAAIAFSLVRRSRADPAPAADLAAAGAAAGLTRLSPRDAAAAADVLAEALALDPLFTACSAESHDAASRRAALRSLFSSGLPSLLRAGSGAVALASARGDALAVWLPAGARVEPAITALHGAIGGLARLGGWARSTRLWLYSQAVEPRRERLTAGRGGRFVYLLVAGARPGAGAEAACEAVLRPVLAHADAAGAACFTEQTDPAMAPLLARLGFAPADDFTMFGVPVVVLVREPVKAA